ncbi:hypothetical protein BH11PSE2_BH11PSE2_18210 [soil metagenome]
MASSPPKKLNIGSGKDFRPDYLNVDVTDYWSPDIVADVSAGFPSPEPYATRRFGEIVLEPASFDEIIAIDVLEHVPDLVATMTNCLALLRLGGVFNILVPHDLSFGAWQDPTHIRAFNERSWLYYTDWSWYLGWTQARFIVQKLEFIASPIGQDMLGRGAPVELVARTPRAVDSMQVSLEKVALNDADKAMLESLQARRVEQSKI